MDADQETDALALLRAQAGVVARRQLLGLGVTDSDIERKLRRREWARMHEGVYVDHTGPPTWEQRAWAAVLFYAPAALSGASGLQAYGLRGFERSGDAPIQVCVDRSRSVLRRPGIIVEQLTGWSDRCQLHLSPPRLRLEDALLGEASACAREDAALAVLADGVQQRRTTVARLARALEKRPRLRHRRLLSSILEDVDRGAYSVLEQRYLVKVERPHGLPTARRQRRVKQGSSPAHRDVDYLGLRTVVELDGRLGHEEALDRWRDLDRDLASTLAGDLTLRVGWKQVLEPCRLAGIVGQILRAHGWEGQLRACGPDCAEIPAPGAGISAQTG